MNPSPKEEQFRRVIDLADVPDFQLGQRVNVEKLLDVRESADCRELRAWLTTLEGISDAEIKRMVSGLRNRLGALASSTTGKLVRFVATNAVGIFPPLGIPLGLVDAFFLERIFPRSGVYAFLTSTYPSLFARP
jgi:hypothetical protein